MYVQLHGYFVLLGIGNVNIPFPNPLVVTALQHLLINTQGGGGGGSMTWFDYK